MSNDDKDLLAELERRGYDVSDAAIIGKGYEFDLVDQTRFDEITDKFYNANWQQREEIWKIVKGL